MMLPPPTILNLHLLFQMVTPHIKDSSIWEFSLDPHIKASKRILSKSRHFTTVRERKFTMYHEWLPKSYMYIFGVKIMNMYYLHLKQSA